MTDRELLKLAAKAGGIELWHEDVFINGLTIKVSANGVLCWNPLTNDGDALRLAVKLGICLGPNFDNDRAVADSGESMQHHVCELFGDDKYAATRRAIVRAAAEIGKEMP